MRLGFWSDVAYGSRKNIVWLKYVAIVWKEMNYQECQAHSRILNITM